MKKAITVEKIVYRTAREKRQAAERSARWRERKATDLVDVRMLDKVISEAAAMHAREMVPADQKKFLTEIVKLAVKGLAYQGHDEVVVRNRVVDRLSYWVGSEQTSGTVRAALDREALPISGKNVAA